MSDLLASVTQDKDYILSQEFRYSFYDEFKNTKLTFLKGLKGYSYFSVGAFILLVYTNLLIGKNVNNLTLKNICIRNEFYSDDFEIRVK